MLSPGTSFSWSRHVETNLPNFSQKVYCNDIYSLLKCFEVELNIFMDSSKTNLKTIPLHNRNVSAFPLGSYERKLQRIRFLRKFVYVLRNNCGYGMKLFLESATFKAYNSTKISHADLWNWYFIGLLVLYPKITRTKHMKLYLIPFLLSRFRHRMGKKYKKKSIHLLPDVLSEKSAYFGSPAGSPNCNLHLPCTGVMKFLQNARPPKWLMTSDKPNTADRFRLIKIRACYKSKWSINCLCVFWGSDS